MIYQSIIRLFTLFIVGTLQTLGVLPTSADTVAAAAITATSNAGAWTWGAYAEIVSAVNNTATSKVIGLTLENLVVLTSSAAQGEVQLATGAGGAEVVFATVPIVSPSYAFPFARMIPAGTRIACRLRTSQANANTVDVKVQTLLGANIF